MGCIVSRRHLFQLAGGASLLRASIAGAQQAPAPAPAKPRPRLGGRQDPFPEFAPRSTVAVIQGESRRKNAYQALMAIDKELQPKLKRKKYVLIKPNIVTTTAALGATNADALRGILDYLSERFKGPVVIGESSAGETLQGYDNFGYPKLVAEYRKQQLKLVDFNEEAKYQSIALLDADLHLTPTRLAARLFDPDAFVLSSSILKTHNAMIATLSVKNMVLGAPLHQAPKETPRWNEKRKMHVGLRQMHYNMMLTAQKLHPNWGAAFIDGFEGMEGSGPAGGTAVASRIAIASTDYIAADRVGLEAMSIDPEWIGYLKYCGSMGLGQYDLAKIDVVGPKLADIKKPYKMHPDIERELKWQGPMIELPFNLGWTTPMSGSPAA
jgi:uncharacterized protein (DUF362 family)